MEIIGHKIVVITLIIIQNDTCLDNIIRKKLTQNQRLIEFAVFYKLFIYRLTKLNYNVLITTKWLITLSMTELKLDKIPSRR